MDLYGFLNPAKIENEKVVISDRFKDKDGKVESFEIRAVGQDEVKALRKKHTRRDKKTGNEIFDSISFSSELLPLAVVYPPLESAELQKAYGVMGASNLLEKMLTAGEYQLLDEKVGSICKLNDINEKINEVKN